MKSELKQNAYAKLNLHLEVLNKRSDNYHNIISFMTKVAYADLLKLEEYTIFDSYSSDKVKVTITTIGGIYKESFSSINHKENLIYKAVHSFCKFVNISGSFSFQIEKNIPFGAGLGGGSSNAAATLHLLNQVYGKISNTELVEIGKSLGADVPFCIIGENSICQGIGEVVDNIEGTLDYRVLIINDGIHSDTAQAYRFLNRGPLCDIDAEHKAEELKKFFLDENKQLFFSACKNDFEEPVFINYPELVQIKQELYNRGADFVQMTGSGSSIFGLFKDPIVANNAYLDLKEQYKLVMLSDFAY